MDEHRNSRLVIDDALVEVFVGEAGGLHRLAGEPLVVLDRISGASR